jgi:c-di-GMP-binding flagellar brake protein YcgR
MDKVMDLIEEASARNTPIEIHRYAKTGDLIGTGKSRVLGFDKNHLHVEQPPSAKNKLVINPGDKIEVFFSLRNTIFRFHTQVVQTRCKIPLNRQTVVLGMHLTMPQALQETQRRADYRINLPIQRQPTVILHDCGKDIEAHIPVTAGRWEGDLIDLSRGGYCVLIKSSPDKEWNVGERYFLGFRTENEPEDFTFMCEVRTESSVLDGEYTRIGVRLLNRPDPALFKRKLQALGKFITQLERSAMRKESGTG